MNCKPIAALIGAFVLIADLLSKFWIQATLPVMGEVSPVYPYGGIAVFQNFFGIQFSIVHATNRGAAWGLFSDFQIPLLMIRALLVVALLLYLLFWNRERNYLIPLTLIIVGAIGNIFDYFLYGHVIDLFHFVFFEYDYPVFNVADASIFVGVAWIILSSFWSSLDENR